MIHLPTEIIIIIFQYLSQKYISIGSTICREWHNVLSQPLFYKTIHIYSISQIKRCIKLAMTRTIDDQLFGYYVENIHFHTDRSIPNQTLINILNAFPNLHCIKGLNKQQQQLYAPSSHKVTIQLQNQLEHLFYWYQGYTEQWMDTLDNNHHKIKSLEFCMRNNLLVLNKEENQYSTIPIINFTSISSVVPQYNEFSHINSRGCKIYTIKLPMMPCLSKLSIDCSIFNGDEHMLESIHQSCPQLKSLTLHSFNMFISEIYNNKSNEISNQLLQPNVYLKELCIDNRLSDPKCYDYLSFKYPHLESFSLCLISTRYPESSLSSFKLAIFKMITQYSCLKKLKVRFINDIGEYRFWPRTELLEWLQHNPTQLIDLDYPYNFTVQEIEKNNTEFSHNMLPLAATFMYHPIQQHDYLNHLSSLSLGAKSSSAINSLFYFYLCRNKNSNNVISSSIEELELVFSNFGNIYFWLNGFPNLKSLSITGYYGATQVIDSIDISDDDKYSSSMYFREVLYYLKKKMKQQQKILKDSSSSSLSASTSSASSTSSSTEVESTTKFYKLKRIEIKNCYVNFEKHGWDGFFKHLPDLKTIILSDINRVNTIKDKNKRKLVKLPIKQAAFDLSHLSLDLLKVSHFNYEPYYLWKTSKIHCVKELMINETSLDKVYYVGPDNISSDTPFHSSNSTTLNIICKYIEHIDFHNN